jgi:hypothetical protein
MAQHRPAFLRDVADAVDGCIRFDVSKCLRGVTELAADVAALRRDTASLAEHMNELSARVKEVDDASLQRYERASELAAFSDQKADDVLKSVLARANDATLALSTRCDAAFVDIAGMLAFMWPAPVKRSDGGSEIVAMAMQRQNEWREEMEAGTQAVAPAAHAMDRVTRGLSYVSSASSGDQAPVAPQITDEAQDSASDSDGDEERRGGGSITTRTLSASFSSEDTHSGAGEEAPPHVRPLEPELTAAATFVTPPPVLPRRAAPSTVSPATPEESLASFSAVSGVTMQSSKAEMVLACKRWELRVSGNKGELMVRICRYEERVLLIAHQVLQGTPSGQSLDSACDIVMGAAYTMDGSEKEKQRALRAAVERVVADAEQAMARASG